MRSLREQLQDGTAYVGRAKLTFRAFGQEVKINRGALFDPKLCVDALGKRGFGTEQIAAISEMLWADGDLRSLLREYDPQASPAKKARDRRLSVAGAYQPPADEEAPVVLH